MILSVGARLARHGLTSLVLVRTGRKPGVQRAAAMATAHLPAAVRLQVLVARLRLARLRLARLRLAHLQVLVVRLRLAHPRALVVKAAVATTRTGTPTAIIQLAA